MVRRHDNLHRDRAEQLKLRGNLANVYDVVRDLGLHYELKEISGCTFITIGRTQHKYSHLDKDLVWTVSTDRACDNQYAEQNNVILGDVTATASETILGLQRTAQEQEEEIRMLNTQLTNLSSNLQAVNSLASEKAGTNLGLHNLTQEQDEEIRRLNTKLVNLSSKLQTANEKEKALLNSQENAHEKEEEMRKINQKLSQLSRLLEVINETKTKAEHSAQESIKEIEELEGRIDRSEKLRKAEDDFAKQNLQRGS
jgi:chromosome segregation ATPase